MFVQHLDICIDCRRLTPTLSLLNKQRSLTRVYLVEDGASALQKSFFYVLARQSTGLQEHQLVLLSKSGRL